MPQTKRDLLKRQADEALNDLGRAAVHMEELAVVYEQYHPDYSKAFRSVKKIIEQASEFLAALRDRYI